MAGPIGYVPPANPYAAMPLEQPKFTGLNVLPAQAAATQAMAPVEQKIQQSEQIDDQAKKAAEFQRLLSQGVSGLQSYVSDVQKDNPELAGQFGQELQTMSPLFQNLKGKDLNDAVFNMYDSWNGRYNGVKMGKVMADPNSTEKDVFGAYAQYGGNPDKMMGAYAGIQKTNAQIPYWDARANESKARAAYTAGRADLQTKLAEIAAEAKVRAQRLRMTKDGSGYQASYKDAKDAYDSIQKRIDELTNSDPSSTGDPDTGQPYPLWQRNMIRENVGWNKTMNDLVKEQNQWRRVMDRTMEHGAKPNESIDHPVPVTAPAAPGADASPAAPAPSMSSISSSAPPDVIKNYLRAINPSKEPSDQDVQRAIQALKASGQ